MDKPKKTAFAARGNPPLGYLHGTLNLPEEVQKLKAQRDALLEALRTLLSYAFTLEMRLLDADGEHRAMQKARAAIKAVEGEKS